MLFFNGLEQWGLLTLRISLGVIFAYHAIPKLKMPGAMAKGIGWLSGFVIILGLVEFFSSLAVILGVYTEVGAFFLCVVMLGALYYKIFKWKIPFYVMDKTGWEFDLILLGASITLLFTGAGTISLDALIGVWP